ncbi:Fur family transcriptional regulator [Neptunomonas antarctica]|uniref:Ferric uptake regulation protein n=1 Tax=Neptunomonas antarctica TaxID=619304 RepID=A0A1N7IV08_9GAMM|nr:Fur family transcriptional regulator [Neptunomonas antarctica]SIS40894.1 Fur family transcriptional regulator, zinc uptake regulator [Neptunomonas antarctica]
MKNELAFQPSHDHSRCITQALQEAAHLCRGRQQRFTPVRELVLKLIWQSHKPLGAYDLLPALAAAGFNSAPPTVYRALDFLQEQGLVHRIASLNAFIGCSHPEHPCNNSFLICIRCQSAVELESDAVSQAIKACAAEIGFSVVTETLEVAGVCPNCQQEDSKP